MNTFFVHITLKDAKVIGQSHKSRHTCSGLFLQPDLRRSDIFKGQNNILIETLMGNVEHLLVVTGGLFKIAQKEP